MLNKMRILSGLCAIGVLTTLIVMPGCSSSNGNGYDIDEHLRQAWIEFDTDDYDDAMTMLSPILTM